MKIIIPGIPTPQARMRHTNRGGFVKTYDPNAKIKQEIRGFLQDKKSLITFLHPRISFLFHMPIPKSIRKMDHDIYHSGLLKHDKKPDVDNFLKLYLDCLDGIIIHGDQKVSLGPCVKVYHPEPKTIIWIDEMDKILTYPEFSLAFQDASQLA